jgi:hypothetical protein
MLVAARAEGVLKVRPLFVFAHVHALAVVVVQTLQLMIVGTVGADHPCQAVCSITAIDFTFFEEDENGDPVLSEKPVNATSWVEGEPTLWEPYHHALVKLPLQPSTPNTPPSTFHWSGNETAVLNVDILELSQAVNFLDNNTYWWVGGALACKGVQWRLRVHVVIDATAVAQRNGPSVCWQAVAGKSYHAAWDADHDSHAALLLHIAALTFVHVGGMTALVDLPR